jgi:predicted HTH transcriptional regulator
MYNNIHELIHAIEAGEDSFIDFKEVRAKGKQLLFASKQKPGIELAKDLSCFANTEGGVIVFGVRDDGERLGIDKDIREQLKQFIINTSQNNVEPPIGHLLVLDWVMIPDSKKSLKRCLKLEIKKAIHTIHAPIGKRPYWRIGDQCHEMTLDQQARLFERRGMLTPFEERPVYLSKKDVLLNSQLFSEYYQQRYPDPLNEIDIPLEQLLENIKLLSKDETNELYPTALGLLLFSSRPDKWITGAYIDIVMYYDSTPNINFQEDCKSIYGSIVQQIEQTMEYLKRSPFLPVRANKNDLGRLDKPAYSLLAIQEALVNAVIHRDYTIQGSQIRIFLFSDRIEISNPGGLHNSLTPEALFSGCQPVRRNQMLAGFLREYRSVLTNRSYMEGKGTGFLTMVRECLRISGKKPDFDIIGDSVKVTIWADQCSSKTPYQKK